MSHLDCAILHGIEDLQALYGVGRVLVDGDRWPNWYPGNAFRAARDKMMAEPKPAR